MEQQVLFTEVINPIPESRPDFNHPKIKETALRAILPEVIEWMGDEGQLHSEQEILDDLIKCSDMFSDGYEIAKKLERVCGWSCDSELVEILNDVAHQFHNACDELQAQWVEKHQITLDKPVGTVVTYKGNEGTITRLEVTRAKYIVNVPALGHVKEGVGTLGVVLDKEVLDTLI